MTRKSGIALVIVAVASTIVGSHALAALTQPFFELAGGVVSAEAVVGSGNFIPTGSLGASSVISGGNPAPVTVTLRDPGYEGDPRTVCVDYIGTDAAYQNRFTITGTAINWCNKLSCADPTATPLGVGGLTWTPPYTASACFQMNVGEPVPFVFIADVLNQGGDGTHTVGNGQAITQSHWAAFPLPFVSSPPMPTSSPVIGVGLADGAFDPQADDDHQDFVVRFTVQGVYTPQTPIPTLGQWGLILLVLSMSMLGLRSVRRARR